MPGDTTGSGNNLVNNDLINKDEDHA